ncbi:hypothetical protein Ahia01_001281300 [Argonauta hians]
MTAAPFFYNPLTKMSEHWFHYQLTPCGDLELDFYRCVSRVGYNRFQLNNECSLEFADFKECVGNTKQSDRYKAMQAERTRQKRPYLDRPQDHSAMA